MLNALLFPDGGGVTINHPAWSRLNKDHVLEMLDYDPRILGIEVLNGFSGGPENHAWSEDYWDYALGTGRQCFGFFVPDWGVVEGVNILLVPEKTPHACLKAYRQGNWYGAIKGRKILNFRSIRFDGKTLYAQTDKPARFQIISKSGVVLETEAAECSLDVSPSDSEKYGFLRIKAFAVDDSGEILFSQPFMLDD